MKICKISDWSNITTFEPDLYFKPQTMDSLISFLNFMHSKQIKFRLIGSLHSCSYIFESGAIVDISDLPKAIAFNADNSEVTASANWQLRNFLIEVSKKDKSLPATGGTDEQTLAGLISTNTAPATKDVSMYEGLTSVTYLIFDNNRNSYVSKTLKTTDKEFLSAVCSLGVIGILITVQFKLIQQPYYNTIQKVIPIADVLTDLDKTSRDYDFWRIDWLCDTDKGLFWGAKKVPVTESQPDGDYKSDEATGVLGFVFKCLNQIDHKIGALQTPIIKIIYGTAATFYGIIKATGPLRNMLPVDRNVDLRVAMAEWSFAPQNLNQALAVYKSYFAENGWPNMPIEIELTKTDNYHMSPWNWPGLPYIVKINLMYMTQTLDNPQEQQAMHNHIHGLWNKLISSGIKFKAHWGKLNFMDHEFVKTHYNLEAFTPSIQSNLLNDYLSQRLSTAPIQRLVLTTTAQQSRQGNNNSAFFDANEGASSATETSAKISRSTITFE